MKNNIIKLIEQYAKQKQDLIVQGHMLEGAIQALEALLKSMDVGDSSEKGEPHV